MTREKILSWAIVIGMVCWVLGIVLQVVRFGDVMQPYA